MKYKRIIGIVLLSIISAMLGYVMYEKGFFKKEEATTVPTTTIGYSQEQEVIPVEYEVPLDKEWLVSFGESLDTNTIQKETVYVQDKEGNRIDVPVSLINNNQTVSIKAPQGGYQKGEYYELHMTNSISYPDGEHVSSYLKQGFITVRDEVERAVYSKNVKTIEDSAVLSVTKTVVTLDKLKIKEEIKKDNILILPSENELTNKQAIKVKDIQEKNSQYVIEYTKPKFPELFEKLDIYKTYNLSMDKAQFTPEEGVQSKEIGMVKPSRMIAGSKGGKANGKEEFTFDGEKETAFTVSPKENGIELGITDIEVDFNGLNAKLDGTYRLFDPNFHFDIDVDWMEIEKLNSYFTYYSSAELRTKLPLTSEERKKLKEIARKNKDKKWILEKEVTLGKLMIPTEIPGIIVTTEISLVLGLSPDGEVRQKRKAELKSDITLESFVNTQVSPKVGIITKDKKIQPIYDLNPEIDAGLVAKGEMKGKITGELQSEITAFDIVGIGLEGEAGGYASGEFNIGGGATIKNRKEVKPISCGKYEYGLLFSGQAEVNTDWEEEMFAAPLFEIKFKLDSKNTCEKLEDIQVNPDNLILGVGKKKELEIEGIYTDLLTGTETKKSLLEGKAKDKLSLETEDTDIANVYLRQYKKESVEPPGGQFKNGEWTISIKGASPAKFFKAYVAIPKDVSSDKTTIDVKYDAFHKEIPVKIKGGQKAVTEKEAKNIVDNVFNNIDATFRETGEKYQWDYDTPYDFNVLRQELVKYAVPSFVDSELKEIAKYLYRNSEGSSLPKPLLNTRFKLIENKPNYFVAETIQFSVGNGISDNGGYVKFAMKKDKGKWLLEKWEETDYTKRPLKLTWKEVSQYLKEIGMEAKYVTTTEYMGREVFAYEYTKDGTYNAMFRDSGEELGVLSEELVETIEKAKNPNARKVSFESYEGDWNDGSDSCKNGVNVNLNFISPTEANAQVYYSISGTEAKDCEDANIDEMAPDENYDGSDLKLSFNNDGVAQVKAYAGRNESALFNVMVKLENNKMFFSTKRISPVHTNIETYFGDGQTYNMHMR